MCLQHRLIESWNAHKDVKTVVRKHKTHQPVMRYFDTRIDKITMADLQQACMIGEVIL